MVQRGNWPVRFWDQQHGTMGSHYNPVSISIVNSETALSITTAWRHTSAGLYNLFQEVLICNDDECSFCTILNEQIQGEEGRPWREHLASDACRAHDFPVDKPASDNSKALFSSAKERFGRDSMFESCWPCVPALPPLPPLLPTSPSPMPV